MLTCSHNFLDLAKLSVFVPMQLWRQSWAVSTCEAPTYSAKRNQETELLINHNFFKRKSTRLKLRQGMRLKFHSKTISLDPNEFERAHELTFQLHLLFNANANANALLYIDFTFISCVCVCVSSHSSIIYPHLFPHSLYDKHNHRFLFAFISWIDQIANQSLVILLTTENYMLRFNFHAAFCLHNVHVCSFICLFVRLLIQCLPKRLIESLIMRT